MKKNQIQGIINDFIDYRGYENPIHHFWLKEKLEINLISGKINYLEEDSFTEFYKHKRKWFMGRVKKLKGKLADFQEAKVIVFGAKEKIFIEYKDKTFEKVIRENEYIKYMLKITFSFIGRVLTERTIKETFEDLFEDFKKNTPKEYSNTEWYKWRNLIKDKILNDFEV